MHVVDSRRHSIEQFERERAADEEQGLKLLKEEAELQRTAKFSTSVASGNEKELRTAGRYSAA